MSNRNRKIIVIATAVLLSIWARAEDLPSPSSDCIARMPVGFVRTADPLTENPWFTDVDSVVNFHKLEFAVRSRSNIYLHGKTTQLLNYKTEERAKEVLVWLETKMKACK